MPFTDSRTQHRKAGDLSRSFRMLAKHNLNVPVKGIHIHTYQSANGKGLHRAVISVVVDTDLVTNEQQTRIVDLVRRAAEGRVRKRPQIMIAPAKRTNLWLSGNYGSPAVYWPTHSTHTYIYN